MISIIHTLLFFTWMWILLFLAIILLIPVFLLMHFRLEKQKDRYVSKVTEVWARHLFFTAGARVTVKGKENVQADRSVCIIGNHQSNFDTPLLLGFFPGKVGFIGKSEMRKIPFFNSWMRALNCVFINRKSIRDSVITLKKAMDNIQSGTSMSLFPEGTRSRRPEPGLFHPAGIRIALASGVPIQPITIRNTCRLYEYTKRIRPADVELIIHPVFTWEGKDKHQAVEELIQIITAPLNPESKGDSP